MYDEFENSFEDNEDTVIAREGQVTPVPWFCAVCGEENETLLDLTGGYHQEYTEDCAVCCRPNVLTLTVDAESMAVAIRNELE